MSYEGWYENYEWDNLFPNEYEQDGIEWACDEDWECVYMIDGPPLQVCF